MTSVDRLITQVTVSSVLASGGQEVWNGISTLEGVNLEMGPWIRMTAPEGMDLGSAAEGEVLKLKLTGPGGLPMGIYPLELKEMVEGEGFLEQTWMFRFLLWQHERRITAAGGGGTLITDSLGWKWKPAFFDRLLAAGVRSFFRHRHRKLREIYGVR